MERRPAPVSAALQRALQPLQPRLCAAQHAAAAELEEARRGRWAPPRDHRRQLPRHAGGLEVRGGERRDERRDDRHRDLGALAAARGLGAHCHPEQVEQLVGQQLVLLKAAHGGGGEARLERRLARRARGEARRREREEAGRAGQQRARRVPVIESVPDCDACCTCFVHVIAAQARLEGRRHALGPHHVQRARARGVLPLVQQHPKRHQRGFGRAPHVSADDHVQHAQLPLLHQRLGVGAGRALEVLERRVPTAQSAAAAPPLQQAEDAVERAAQARLGRAAAAAADAAVFGVVVSATAATVSLQTLVFG